MAVVEAAASLSVLLPLPGAARLEGAKVAVIPTGAPLTDSAIAELNPFTRAVVKVICAEPPRATVALVVLGDSVNPGVNTVRLRV